MPHRSCAHFVDDDEGVACTREDVGEHVVQGSREIEEVNAIHNNRGLIAHGRKRGAELGLAHRHGDHVAVVHEAHVPLAHGLARRRRRRRRRRRELRVCGAAARLERRIHRKRETVANHQRKRHVADIGGPVARGIFHRNAGGKKPLLKKLWLI